MPVSIPITIFFVWYYNVSTMEKSILPENETDFIKNRILEMHSEVFSYKRAIEELEKSGKSDADLEFILRTTIDLLKNHIIAKKFLLEKGKEFLGEEDYS
jgi:hypothetical protein